MNRHNKNLLDFKQHETISILIPYHNERDNVPLLYKKFTELLKGYQYHLIFIDDGSTDASSEQLEKVSNGDESVMIIHSSKRLGKGNALRKGLRQAKGSITVFIDADLQNDPEDIFLFFEYLAKGYDVVNGWRKSRHESRMIRWISIIGNKILWKHLLQTGFHDLNCGFKAFRSVVLQEVHLYGDNFRFLPYVAEQKGFNVTEIKIANHPRKYGQSKYSALKAVFGVFDTLTTYFIIRFSEKPFHFFGVLGIAVLFIGTIIGCYLTYEWLVLGEVLSRRPLLQLVVLLMVGGLQILLTGIIAELIVFVTRKKND